MTGKKEGKHIIDPAEEVMQYEFSNCLFCLACQVSSQHRRPSELRLKQPRCVCGALGVQYGQGAVINTCVSGTSQHWVLPQCSQAFIMLFKVTKSYTAAKISLPVNKLEINWHLSNIIPDLE